MQHYRKLGSSLLQVVLRLPAMFMMEAWLLDQGKEVIQKHVVAYFLYLYGVPVVAAVLLLVPLKNLIQLYVILVSDGLLLVSKTLSKYYIQKIEEESMEEKFVDSSTLLNDTEFNINLLMIHLLAQCVINAIIGYLLKLSYTQQFLLIAYCVPTMGHWIGLPTETLFELHYYADKFVLLLVALYIANNLPGLVNFIYLGITDILRTWNNFGSLFLLTSIWRKYLMSVQFAIFWVALYGSHLMKYCYFEEHPVFHDTWYMVAFSCIGEACATTLSIIGACVTVSYVSELIMLLTKVFLQGLNGYVVEDIAQHGLAEGMTMLLLAFQTGLIELQPVQRAFVMLIILFIVLSSLVQSLYEMTHPYLLALSASQNRNYFSHAKAILVMTVLWTVPLIMSYKILQFFEMNAWLLIIVLSCIVTSIQVWGSLIVYVFFMYDSVFETSWHGLDDAVYYTRATTRVIEFIVAVCVVAYGTKECIFGEWSWINSSIIIVHFYFNIWQRLQEGWKTFLLRRDAVRKIESLPLASQEELKNFNDVCAICYQEMTSARVTHCKHYFHALCLRKWLYVQENCPMCHKKITPSGGQVPNQTGTEQTQSQNEGVNNEQPYDRGHNLRQVRQELEDVRQNLATLIQQMEQSEQHRTRIHEHLRQYQQPTNQHRSEHNHSYRQDEPSANPLTNAQNSQNDNQNLPSSRAASDIDSHTRLQLLLYANRLQRIALNSLNVPTQGRQVQRGQHDSASGEGLNPKPTVVFRAMQNSKNLETDIAQPKEFGDVTAGECSNIPVQKNVTDIRRQTNEKHTENIYWSRTVPMQTGTVGADETPVNCQTSSDGERIQKYQVTGSSMMDECTDDTQLD